MALSPNFDAVDIGPDITCWGAVKLHQAFPLSRSSFGWMSPDVQMCQGPLMGKIQKHPDNG